MPQSDEAAADRLPPPLYQELHKLALARLSKEKRGHMQHPTMLVREVYVRLVNVDHHQQWNGPRAVSIDRVNAPNHRLGD